MRYRDWSEVRKRQVHYGASAVAVLVLVAGLSVLANRVDSPTASVPAESSDPATTGAGYSRRLAVGPSTSPATAPPAIASTTAAQATSGDEVTVVNGLRRDEAVALIGEARRQATMGNYTEAEASLAKAENVMPKLPEIQQAREDIARLKTPEGQFANQLRRARLAIDHDDSASAEASLAEAARFKADAPEIAELRAELQAANVKKARREARVAAALARMRAAIARRDFATADSALNEAERIDVQEPAIRQARRELARARDTRQKVSE
jgi:hypothetical protein